MAYTPSENIIVTSLETVRDFLNLKDAHIIKGGPSIVDPMGIASWYVSFRDKANGFWFSVDGNGNINQFGASLNGKSYKFPENERVTNNG